MKRTHRLLGAMLAASLLWGMPTGEAISPEQLHDELVQTAPTDILLAEENRKAMNKRIAQQSFIWADITISAEEVDGEDIRAHLADAAILSGDCWYRGALLIDEQKKNMISNQNANGLGILQSAGYGIVIRRSNVRALPEGFGVFSSKEDMLRDRLQITALDPGEAVRLLHRSSDMKYWFVQSSTACGWVAVTDIAKANRKDWLTFADPTDFVVITASGMKIKGGGETVYCQMGARLPLISEQENTYKVIVPYKSRNGNVGGVEVLLDKNDDVQLGYLAYTKQNLAKQAIRYSGAPYGWHGQRNSEDSAGAAADIYRTMGVSLPTSAQQHAAVNKNEADSLPGLTAADGQTILTVGTLSERDYILEAAAETGIRLIGEEDANE